ncbi:MAG: DUF2156 domain-containing protein [Microbacteriaceae bacterium]|nr:DUF2156 domain-containing protein [Microbacteriaceae bacterium]
MAEGTERGPGFLATARRTFARYPATTVLLVAYLGTGVASAALWTPFRDREWFDLVAYGLPAFAEGRWWTVVTGAFFSEVPWHYPLVAVLAVVAMGTLERLRGTRWAIGGFWIGQIGGVLVSAALIDALRITGWGWPAGLATVLDVGPSCGLLAVAALAIAALRAPWRFRGRLLLGALLLVLLVLEGTLADLEHAVSGGLVLLFGFGLGRGQRATVHEWRVLAFGSVAVIGIMQLVAAIVPTDGPLGPTDPGEVAWWDVGIDVLVAVVISWSLVRGRRWAWIVAIVLAGFNILQAVYALTVMDGDLSSFEGAGVAAAASLLWVVALLLLVAGRHAFAVPVWRRGRFLAVDAGQARERLLAVLRRHGGGTLSWMSTWPRMRVRFGADDAWALPVRRVGGVAIVLGDPIGPQERWPEAIADFRAAAELDGVVPCVFSASRAAADAAVAEDPQWRSIAVAEDTIVDLPGLEFTGKQWQPVRGAANRAEREGVRFRLTRLADEPWGVVAQVRAISESWVGDKSLPEMGFTLGGVDEALDPAVRVALAVDGDGSVHGVLSWLPVYGPAESTAGPYGDDGEDTEDPDVLGSPEHVVGWVLDVMRRRDGGFGPAMEFLIGQSLVAFRDEGARYASLSGAPLTRSEEDADEDGAIGALLTTVGGLLEPAYGFGSLHRFKEKFHPRHESMRLLYRDEAELPRIAAAIVRAYLPDASPGQLVRTGLSLGRR